MPQLVIKSHPQYPVMVPPLAHQCQIYPLQAHQSDSSNWVWTMPYLLIRQVMLPIAHVKVKTSILLRDLVPHGAFKGAVINQGHCKWEGVVDGKVTSKLLEQMTPTTISFIGSRGLHMPHIHVSKPTFPPFTSTTYHATIIPLWYMPSSFPMHSFLHVSYLYVFLFSLWLTWLTDPALVTLVYPNQMQYTPRVLQEASLLDGVDASVHGNGRRFSKTSSCPLSGPLYPNAPSVLFCAFPRPASPTSNTYPVGCPSPT